MLETLFTAAVIGVLGYAKLSEMSEGAKSSGKSLGEYSWDKTREFGNEARSARERASSMSDNEIIQAYKDSNSMAEKIGYGNEMKRRHGQD